MKTWLFLILFDFHYVSAQTDTKLAKTGSFAIQASHSALWYNSNQSGHGLSVYVLDNNRIVIFWYVYDNAGGPLWLLGIGTHDGYLASLDVTQYSGALFPPNFNSEDVNGVDWGTFQLSFVDCNNGLFSWEPVSNSNFSSGQMEIVRLTQTLGLKCNTVDFINPQKVTIVGYSGDAQEPFISRDGALLFFNNLNSATLPNGMENDTNIHYASRIDESTFQYVGELSGASTNQIPDENELEAVASMDKNNTFFFVNTTDYLNSNSDNYLLSLFEADYGSCSLSNIKSLPNLKMNRPVGQNPQPGELNFDAEINNEGDTLYFVEGIFSGNPLPDEANIGIANKINGEFVVNQNSEALFDLVNTENLEYAPSISSNELELYFTRAIPLSTTTYDFGLYVATRDSVTDTWKNIKRLNSLAGEFTEAPSISGDGKLLYYHQKTADKFSIYVAKRK